MCGIVGQLRFDGRPVDPAVLESMCAALEHRGPDSRGVHTDRQAGIGIQRLRVIDLETGDQPIFNEDRSVAVVLNGEIYNFRELRADLERRGHRFSTAGDTEVIVHLYEEHGPRCVEHLHGMFALAIWDSRRERLVLARDRVGKKPLVYAESERGLSFASELRSLMADPEVPREPDLEALDVFLTYSYVPAPLTAFAAARKLEPATILVHENGHARTERYWQLDYGRKRDVEPGPELYEEIREQIRQAVRRRLVSDVPLGVFLSGGIDSSAVVAAMAEVTGEIKTFTIGFEDESLSELPNAREIATRFGTDHHEFVLQPDPDVIPEVVRHYGEPFGDSSSVPSFQVAKLAREHVTVVLNGDGGDESFGGYNHYSVALRTAGLTRLPLALRRMVSSIAVRSRERGHPGRTANRIRRVAAAMALDVPERYAWQLAHAWRDELYSEAFREIVGETPPDVIREPWRAATAGSVIDTMLEVDINTLLPDRLLVKMDIASMAHGLEARSPFLDHQLMEFAAELPPALKLRGSEKKVVLRDALRGWLPETILDGPKQGFGLPIADQWFRGPLSGFIREVLTDPGTLERGYFQPAYVNRLLDSHISGRESHTYKLWTLMMFELWHREFVGPSKLARG